MSPGDAAIVCNKVSALFPTIGQEQLEVLHARIVNLPITVEQAEAALAEEVLQPSGAKVQRVAAVWSRLSRLNAPTARPGAEGWQPPSTFGEVLATIWKSGEPHLTLVQKYIASLQSRCASRLGECYARDHACKLWMVWRRDLMDHGMAYGDATTWLIENAYVERSWAVDLHKRYAVGRDKQVVRMKRLAAEWESEQAAQENAQ